MPQARLTTSITTRLWGLIPRPAARGPCFFTTPFLLQEQPLPRQTLAITSPTLLLPARLVRLTVGEVRTAQRPDREKLLPIIPSAILRVATPLWRQSFGWDSATTRLPVIT